jgi:hypothetical protein
MLTLSDLEHADSLVTPGLRQENRKVESRKQCPTSSPLLHVQMNRGMAPVKEDLKPEASIGTFDANSHTNPHQTPDLLPAKRPSHSGERSDHTLQLQGVA